MRLLASTIACLLVLATGAAGAAAAPSRQPSPAKFTLQFQGSGGLGSINRGLFVEAGQSATALTGRPDGSEIEVEFQLGAGRIRSLERGLSRAHFASLESPGPSGCADCFEYSILYRGHQLELDESQMPPRLGAVIAQIEAIITAHTAKA